MSLWFKDDKGLGGKYITGDIQTAIKLGVTSYLVVPNSSYIGSFDPSRYNALREDGYSHERAKNLATHGRAIKIY